MQFDARRRENNAPVNYPHLCYSGSRHLPSWNSRYRMGDSCARRRAKRHSRKILGMLRKRHSPEEIATKLLQSDAMAEAGKPQAEIAHALGVSLMTYHRWRKARLQAPSAGSSASNKNAGFSSSDRGELVERISHLHSENSRLRSLVTDLLLETDRLEEVLALPRSRNWTKVSAAPDQKHGNTSRRLQKRRQTSIFTPTGKIR